MPIISQSNIANSRGLMPTDLIAVIDKLAPMRNNVSTRPFFAIHTSACVSSDGKLQ